MARRSSTLRLAAAAGFALFIVTWLSMATLRVASMDTLGYDIFVIYMWRPFRVDAALPGRRVHLHWGSGPLDSSPSALSFAGPCYGVFRSFMVLGGVVCGIAALELASRRPRAWSPSASRMSTLTGYARPFSGRYLEVLIFGELNVQPPGCHRRGGTDLQRHRRDWCGRRVLFRDGAASMNDFDETQVFGTTGSVRLGARHARFFYFGATAYRVCSALLAWSLVVPRASCAERTPLWINFDGLFPLWIPYRTTSDLFVGFAPFVDDFDLAQVRLRRPVQGVICCADGAHHRGLRHSYVASWLSQFRGKSGGADLAPHAAVPPATVHGLFSDLVAQLLESFGSKGCDGTVA